MNKLELKHIAPYLPFKPDVISEDGVKFALTPQVFFTFSLTPQTFLLTLKDRMKLVLRPLSELNEDEQLELLEADLGAKMSSAIWWWIDYFRSDKANIDYAILCAPYPVIEWALEKHYDVFSLIPKGLAVPLDA